MEGTTTTDADNILLQVAGCGLTLLFVWRLSVCSWLRVDT